MQRLTTALAIAAIASGTVAYAQPPGFGRPKSPPLSPYLNLLNDNNTTAFNYYQFYRPQTEFRRAEHQLSRGLYEATQQRNRQAQALEQQIEDIEARVRPGATLGTTGHRTSFMNYGKYFPSRQGP